MERRYRKRLNRFKHITSVLQAGSFPTSLISTALAVLTRTLRTRPLLSGKHSSTSAFGQQPRGVLLSHSKTRAPGSKFGDAVHHFCLGCNKGRYSDNHLFQNLSASACVLRQDLRYWSLFMNKSGPVASSRAPVNSMCGVKALKSLGSEDTSVRGRLLRIRSISATRVARSKSSREASPTMRRINLRMLLMILSQTSPECEQAGTLNVQLMSS